jgi:aminoglycoside 6'-N-acetyltransferase I
MRYKLWDQLALDEHVEDIGRMLRSGKRFGYVALVDSHEPAGFAEICIREYANGCTSQPVPFLEGIWVDPRHRRRGAGRTLMTAITADLVAEGFHEICSDAEIRNRRSHQAHRDWGFEETSRVVYFRKQLADPTVV